MIPLGVLKWTDGHVTHMTRFLQLQLFSICLTTALLVARTQSHHRNTPTFKLESRTLGRGLGLNSYKTKPFLTFFNPLCMMDKVS